MIGRAIIEAIRQDEGKIYVQFGGLNGEVVSDAELLSQYGIRSMPRPGSRGVVIAYGGNRDNVTVIAVDDKRVKIPLAEGEVIVYNDDLSFTKYREGNIEHVSATTQRFTVGDTELLIEPDGIKFTVDGAVYDFTPTKLTSSKEVDVTGKVTASGDIETTAGDVKAPGGITLLSHKHISASPGSPSGPAIP